MSQNPTEHLLVIRLSAMGDCAIAVPVLRRLMKAYPQLKITVVTKPFFSPIFKTIPEIDIISVDTKGEYKGLLGVLKLAFQLKKMGFTKVADLHNVLRSKILRFVFFCYGKKTAKIDKGRAEKKALTRTENKVFKPLKTSAQRYADVFKSLDYPVDLSQKIDLKKLDLPQKLHNFIGFSTQKWIGIAPFAAHASKTYPLDLMKQVIAKLNQTNQYKLLLFGGGKKETDLLRDLASQYNQTICIAGNFKFEEELLIMANLDLMISMDSGNGHLAAMYNVPVITLWGETHPYAGFAPFGQPKENQLIPDLKQYPLLPTSVFGKPSFPGYEKVMQTIKPKIILKRIETILNTN